jgi:tetratricopeptide (TPR) repeat protein
MSSLAVIHFSVFFLRRDELAELYKMRGNVRVDLKSFSLAKEDYDRVLELMSDGERQDGTAAYMEYPDTYVQRGLCYEGLGDWASAVADYSKAISLWGGGRGEGINPYVLTFRANALLKLQRYSEAVEDYRAAETLFLQRREEERAMDARANLALALYAMGEVPAAVLAMRQMVRRRPGYADMHVALAAHAWATGNVAAAEEEWEFACDRISVGCSRYPHVHPRGTAERLQRACV